MCLNLSSLLELFVMLVKWSPSFQWSEVAVLGVEHSQVDGYELRHKSVEEPFSARPSRGTKIPRTTSLWRQALRRNLGRGGVLRIPVGSCLLP